MQSYHQTASSSLSLPSDSYIYAIATTSSQNDLRYDEYRQLSNSDQLVVISSDDSLRVLSPETLKLLPDGIFANVNQSVTSVERFAAVGQDCSIFMTTGRDGAVRGWDLRSQKSVVELTNPKGQPLASLDCNFDTHCVVAGSELEGNGPGDVNVFGWDVRNPSTTRFIYAESHTDTITELRYLPYPINSSPNVLMSGSTDGLVNVFDVTVEEEDDAVLQVINHHSAIHHTGLIGDDIYALGTDETLSFYAQQHPDPELEEPLPLKLGDMREQLNCEYMVKLLNHQAAPILAMGNHTSSEHLDLIQFSKTPHSDSRSPSWKPKLNARIRLEEAHGSEIVRDLFFEPSSNTIYTCGEDGIIKQWKGNGSDDIEMGGTSTTAKRKLKGDRNTAEKRSKAGR